MQDVNKVRSFLSKLSAVTTAQETTESLKMLHGNHASHGFTALQDVLLVGRKEEEQVSRRVVEFRDFGVGMPPLASSY
jgi:hypothetical protein